MQILTMIEEFREVSLRIQDSASSALMKKCKLPKNVSSQSINECLDNLFNTSGEELLVSDELIDDKTFFKKSDIPKYRAIRIDTVTKYCDFSSENENNSDLLIQMLCIGEKRDENVASIRDLLQQDVSNAEKRIVHLQDGGPTASQTALVDSLTIAGMQIAACGAFRLIFNKVAWPLQMIPRRGDPYMLWLSSSAILITPAIWGLKVLYDVFTLIQEDENEIIQLEELENNKNIALPLSVGPPKRIEKEKPTASVVVPSIRSSSMQREEAVVVDTFQFYRLGSSLVNGLTEEVIFRGFLLRSLLGYLPPFMAVVISTLCSVRTVNNVYEAEIPLSSENALLLKGLEHSMMNLLAVLGDSILPCLFIRWCFCRQQMIRNEFLRQDDPCLLRVNSPLVVRELLEALYFIHRNTIGKLPSVFRSKPSEEVKSAARLAMSVFSTDHYDSGGSDENKRLLPQDLEDLLVALDWAATDGRAPDDEDNWGLPIIPLSFRFWSLLDVEIFLLATAILEGSPLFLSSKATVINLNFLWPPPLNENDTNDGALGCNSPAFSASQLLLQFRNMRFRILYPNGVSQSELEELLQLLHRTGKNILPLTKLLQASSSGERVRESLRRTEEMDGEALMDLIQERYSFHNEILDLHSPRVLSFVTDRFREMLCGREPTAGELKHFLGEYERSLRHVMRVMDGVFLQDKGLTSRRLHLLVEKHAATNEEVKKLRDDWQAYFKEKGKENVKQVLRIRWRH